MKKYNIAILGATGAVGQEMFQLLFEMKIPFQEIRLLASKKNHGKTLTYDNNVYVIQEASPTSFKNIDIVLCATNNDVAKKFIPYAIQAGAVVIDNSSAFRLDPNVPLCIPEINPSILSQHRGIIANPNCATIIALMALYPLHKVAHLKQIIASTYQAVSGAGTLAIDELKNQVKQLSNNKPLQSSIFPYPIAYNIIPQIGSFCENGYTSEEMKLQNEGRKILDIADLTVDCTCVRIPVIRSHSIALTATFQKEIDFMQIKSYYENQPGVELINQACTPPYPMPLTTSYKNKVYVGRIRKSNNNSTKTISLWCCGDQLRKGAATNAIQIAQLLITQWNKK